MQPTLHSRGGSLISLFFVSLSVAVACPYAGADFDENGILFHIGTRGKTAPWQNPALMGPDQGGIAVTRSSECVGKASDAAGRSPCDSYTHNFPGSWWQFDFGAARRVLPTHYTLRHSNNPDCAQYVLRSWRLEGSLDGAQWAPLDSHADDAALAAQPDAHHTFAVATPDGGGHPQGQPGGWRFLRVLMTGPSPNGNHHLMLSGFEVYGTLRYDGL